MAERIQLRRTKGWRKPEGAIVVSRPSRWGNPCKWWPMPMWDPCEDKYYEADPAEARRISVLGFEAMLADPESRAINHYPDDYEIELVLRGHDLACWCPLDQPCHADVLLRLANTV